MMHFELSLTFAKHTHTHNTRAFRACLLIWQAKAIAVFRTSLAVAAAADLFRSNRERQRQRESTIIIYDAWQREFGQKARQCWLVLLRIVQLSSVQMNGWLDALFDSVSCL